MDIKGRIISLVENNFESDAMFERTVEIGKKTVDKWRRGENASYLKIIPKLCEVFEVSADYLLGLSDVKRPLAAPLTNEQAELLRMFEALDARDKADIADLVASKYARYEPDKKSDTNSGVSSIA